MNRRQSAERSSGGRLNPTRPGCAVHQPQDVASRGGRAPVIAGLVCAERTVSASRRSPDVGTDGGRDPVCPNGQRGHLTRTPPRRTNEDPRRSAPVPLRPPAASLAGGTAALAHAQSAPVRGHRPAAGPRRSPHPDHSPRRRAPLEACGIAGVRPCRPPLTEARSLRTLRSAGGEQFLFFGSSLHHRRFSCTHRPGQARLITAEPKSMVS